jgi:hypothetical protein
VLGACVISRPVCVPDQLFGRQPAHALDERAFDLADVHRRVQRAADVVQDVGAQHFHSPVSVSITTSLTAAP